MTDTVVVTGVGTCSPFGAGSHAFSAGLREGRSRAEVASELVRSDGHAATVCLVPDDALHGVPERARRLSRAHRMAMVAVADALADGQVDLDRFRRERVGVCYGTPSSTRHAEELQDTIAERGPRSVSPLMFEHSTGMAGPGTMAIEYGIAGPTIPLPGGGASGLQGICLASMLLRSGRVDLAIVVAAEEIAPLYYHALELLRVLSSGLDEPEASSRPFDKGRSGIIPGEGAAAVILERASDARERGATAVVELCATVLAHGGEAGSLHSTPSGSYRPHVSAPLERTMRYALNRSGYSPGDVDYIAACANSARALDAMEADALGELAAPAVVSSIASIIGDMGAASGLLNFVGCVKSMEGGFVPPTLNFGGHERPLRLDIATTLRTASLGISVVNAHSLGGACASTVIRTLTERKPQR